MTLIDIFGHQIKEEVISLLNKNLNKLTKQIQKKYGDDIVSIASEANKEINVHSTGSLMLDLAIGGGDRAGIPEGRIMEIYGPESQGKTTLTLLMVAARQKEEEQKTAEDPSYEEKVCIFLDAEHALDTRLANEYGVNLDKLIYIDPDTAEAAMDIVAAYVDTGLVALVIIDSVPSLLPSSIAQSSNEQMHIGTNARLMSSLMQRMVGPCYKNGTTMIFINQVREAIGKYSPTGIAETTPGGRALKFYSSVRLSVRRGDIIKHNGDQTGHVMRIRVVKNKIGTPYKEATISLMYGHGVDKVDEIFQIALKADIIHQGGAWFTLVDKETGELLSFGDDEFRSQGRDNMISLIRKHPEAYQYLEDRLRGVVVEADDMEEEEVSQAELEA